jgi:hypothetical protein
VVVVGLKFGKHLKEDLDEIGIEDSEMRETVVN